MTVRMSQAVTSAACAHARSEYPRECCGLIAVVDGRARYFPVPNTAGTPDEHFIIPAKEYAAIEDQGRIVGLVHSHPNASANPSDADRVMCEASGLTWHIISVGAVDGVPECGDIQSIQPEGYIAPLVGRAFSHGVLDCYTLVRDFYARELEIFLNDYMREDDWWYHGQDLYSLNRLQAEGFSVITDDPRHGDMILMQIRAEVANHAGIYLGDGLMLHHLHGRLSERVPYGGYWQRATRMIVRHREAEQ